METLLLATKLYYPTMRTRRVARQRLYAQLDPLLARKLGLVSAPAGYGKTTLVADWLDHLVQRCDIVAPRVAWFSVEKSDNHPVQFLSYLTASLQEVYPGAGRKVQAALGADTLPPVEPLIIALINEVVSFTTKCVLVLDDYHLIENRVIHRALDFLIDHLPPQLHILICTRADPPLALDRLRVSDHLVEVRPPDLAFTVEEAGAFFVQTMGLGLSSAQVEALTARTEGWAAGLQLAALSLREVNPEQRDRFAATIAGRHHRLARYLLDEAFVQQSPEVQRFLLCSAVVDRFCGSLCDALLDDAAIDGRDMLNRLEAGEVFLAALDPDHQWYRYHDLFRDVLRDRLACQRPALIPELHLRASEWFAAHGQPHEAVEQALAGGHHDRAAALIDGLGCRFAYEGSDTQILSWIDQIPTALHRYYPWLRVAQINALGDMERHNESASLIESLDADAALFPGLPIATCVLLARARCVIRTRYEPCTFLGYGLQAREQLAGQPSGDAAQILGAIAEEYIAHGHWNLGDPSRAEAAFEAMLQHSLAAHSLPTMLRALTQQAMFYQAVGPFWRCAEVCQQGIKMAEQAWAAGAAQAPPPGLVAGLESYLSLMLLLWHRLEEAGDHARRAVELFELAGSQPGQYLEIGLLNLLGVHCALGDYSKAYAVLRKIDRILLGCSQQLKWQMRPKLIRPRIWLSRASPEWRWLLRDAETWVTQAHLDPNHPERHQVREYEGYGNGLLALGRAREAIPWLERGMEKTHAQGWVLSEMLFASWLAVAYDQVGHTTPALESMGRALALAEPERCLEIFTEYGPFSLALLRRFRAMLPGGGKPYSHITPEFVDSVLAVFPEQAAAATREIAPMAVAQPLVEPLSERELDVLRLVGRGLRNQEIAQQLHITTNTVSFHLKNIYGKLDVHNRTEGVAAARELALIP